MSSNYKLQLKRGQQVYASKEEAMVALQNALKNGKAGEPMVAVYKQANQPDANGHEYVDLGLPSGLLWAKCNVGATNEEDTGLYFQWGDTQGYTAEQVGSGDGKKYFGWDDYKFSFGEEFDQYFNETDNYLKYNSSDGKTVLDLQDDAAHVIMGGNWRMPTYDEVTELLQNTNICYVSNNGSEIKGTLSYEQNTWYIRWDSNNEPNTSFQCFRFYSKMNESIFLSIPTNDLLHHGLAQSPNMASIWTSSLFLTRGLHGYATTISGDAATPTQAISYRSRLHGVPIRGVLAV